MPFIAEHDGRRVIPEEVDDSTTVTCPSCHGDMGVRGPFSDGTARHFFHLSETASESCSNPVGGPGESATHRKLKSLAVSALRQRFDGQYSRCGPEITLDVSKTSTDVTDRRADALVEFTDDNVFYGNGIIVEIQHLNKGKDRRGTTHDYLERGFSVYWATPADFPGDQFDIEAMETAFNEAAPPAFSVYHDSPPALEAPTPLRISPEQTDRYTVTDPVPNCDHDFVPCSSGYRECVRCGQQIEWCWYDEHRDQVRLRSELPPRSSIDVFLAVDRVSIDHPVTIREVEEWGDPPDHRHQWGSDKGVFDESRYECWYCDSKLLVDDGRVAIRHRESDSEEWRPDGYL